MKSPSIIVAALGLSLTLLSGCRKDIQNTEAVRQGVVAYLAKRSDLALMDVSIAAVTYRQNEATATVHFQAKGNNTPGSGMTMQYILERKDSQWVVKGRAAGDAHGSQGPGMAVPQGGMAVPPEGSGSMGAMPKTLPPGHPVISPGKKPEPPQ